MDHATQIRHADEEMRRALRIIKAAADQAAENGSLEIPDDVQLDERDAANRYLLLTVGDVIEKRLTEVVA